MKLFLLENESSIDCLVESSAYALGVDVILCFNYLVVVKLKRLSARHLFAFCEDILTATDYDEIHAIADKIDLNWYKFDAEDLTIYQGISFGHLVRGVLSRKYMLPVLIKYGEIIRKALLRWPACNQIVYDLSFKGISGYKILEEHSQAFDKKLLVIEVCRQLNVNAEFFPPLFQLRASINSSSSPSGLASVLMSHMKRLIRVLATFVLNLFGCVVYKFCSGKSIYFPNYFNQISVLQHLSRRFVLRSIAPAISIRGLRYADFDSAHYIPSKADRNFEERLRAVMVRIANDNSSLYSFNDIDYKEVYYKGISDTILRVIPQMVMYLGKVRKVLRQYRIG
ncbi:MAG: hypothetical protein Q7T74_06810, partial [Candidatus Saccharibacteria bacterium]|nr:hypothetical protein [Candidatus Saccharibacteria bacterium]